MQLNVNVSYITILCSGSQKETASLAFEARLRRLSIAQSTRTTLSSLYLTG